MSGGGSFLSLPVSADQTAEKIFLEEPSWLADIAGMVTAKQRTSATIAASAVKGLR
jgi:hypothetical protein